MIGPWENFCALQDEREPGGPEGEPTLEHCHIRPEPIEAPEPQPVRQRNHDLVKARSLSIGLLAMMKHGPAPYSVADFEAGFEACLEYRRRHDRRAW